MKPHISIHNVLYSNMFKNFWKKQTSQQIFSLLRKKKHVFFVTKNHLIVWIHLVHEEKNNFVFRHMCKVEVSEVRIKSIKFKILLIMENIKFWIYNSEIIKSIQSTYAFLTMNCAKSSFAKIEKITEFCSEKNVFKNFWQK